MSLSLWPDATDDREHRRRAIVDNWKIAIEREFCCTNGDKIQGVLGAYASSLYSTSTSVPRAYQTKKKEHAFPKKASNKIAAVLRMARAPVLNGK